MKANVTRRWLRTNYYCCGVGYCELQHLLYYIPARFYTSGVYGWNFDAYIVTVDDVDYCITTGYRGTIREFEAKKVHQYDVNAKNIINNTSLSHEVKQSKVNELLKQFIRETFHK